MKPGNNMDDDGIRWAIGLAVTVVIFVISTTVATIRNFSAKIAKVHERIDKVKDGYVRRDDLDARLDPITQQLTELRQEVRSGNDRVVTALAELKSGK